MAVLMLCAIKSHSSSRREWPNHACNQTRRWLIFYLTKLTEITSRSAHLWGRKPRGSTVFGCGYH